MKYKTHCGKVFQLVGRPFVHIDRSWNDTGLRITGFRAGVVLARESDAIPINHLRPETYTQYAIHFDSDSVNFPPVYIAKPCES